MDKTIETILKELGMSDIPFDENFTMFYSAAYEAMKIAMKQAYHAGRLNVTNCASIEGSAYLFDEYLNKLEEKK